MSSAPPVRTPSLFPFATAARAALPALLLVACGDDGDGSDPADTGADTTVDAADVSADVDDPGADADSGADAGGDVAGDTQPDADAGPTCEIAEWIPPEADLEQTRFALTMFHFNVEYVIGGLEYFDEDLQRMVTFLGLPLNEGWDNDAVEDYIIRETLMPMLEMYAEHPTWQTTFEMQAYAVEVMAERHPDVLELMRDLAQRGQLELVSFHYAAQLFLAYPAEDLERSLERTREVFEAHCLPLSNVVFNQEGQAGEGRQRMLVEQGWRIGVQPKNLWRYVRDGETPWPYYDSEGGVLVVGPGGVDPESGVEVTWPFFDDGELRAVAEGINPYAAALGPHVPARVAEYEDNLQRLEDEGWEHISIRDYVYQLEQQGVERRPAPPLLDGTWQPPSTDSIHRWLGGRSQANVGDEEDNWVRSGNARARLAADATQVLVEVAAENGADTADWEARMRDVWTKVFHAEVSDASGVNPWRAEVLWCARLNDEIIAETQAIRDELLTALDWAHVEVNTAERSATALDELNAPEAPETITPWFTVATAGEARDAEVTWYEGPNDDRAQVQIRFTAADACDGCDDNRISVAFPRTADEIAYTPALIEDEVRTYPFSDFSFLEDEVYLPLANGLIGLGDDVWVIKHTRAVHIAARVAPDDDQIRFIDAALYAETAPLWVFEVVRGTEEEALAVANGINTNPIVIYSR